MLRVLVALVLCSAASARHYDALSSTCLNAKPISGNVGPVPSAKECEAKCDAQAAAAPGTGQMPCVGVDTNGKTNCYLKSVCGGKAGHCGSSECGYRAVGVAPPAPPPGPLPPVPPAPPGVTLRAAAEKHGLLIGAATNVNGISKAGPYKTTEQAQYSLTTAENACKVGPIHPREGPNGFDWKGCDEIFAQADAANQTVRGHNLCWHTENPAWLTTGKHTPAQLRSFLQEHITAVVKHYGERAYCWDVVNEAIEDGGAPAHANSTGLKPSKPWYPAVPNYIDVAFKAAAAARGPGSKVKLFYNDYSADGVNPKSDKVYNLVKGMQERGVPIDGVGLQFHISVQNPPSLDAIAANMARFGKLGLEVHITELDLKCPEGCSLEAQAHLYADILKVCLAAPTCKSFETWGFTDADTWIGAAQRPLPFDEQYSPKPAVAAMINALLNASVTQY
eukprot:COSAG01_NODE_9043_length_2571_cov_4.074838_1_plen_449_part_00